LEFHKCYHGFECAKLSVPLDYYHDTYPDEKVSIAITKLPAKVSVDDPRYAGPILINPGGPGGSGALFAIWVGQNLQEIVDADARGPSFNHSDGKPAESRYYDIIGFDPRGIGWTEPRAVCMDDPAASWSWNLRETTEGILGSSDAALGRLWSMTHAWGASCKQAVDAEDGPDIKQYMSTALVARDMLEIVERHASWVAERLNELKSDKSRCHHEPNPALYKPEETKLQYWGFSYGTFLGSTFSSMFPERVGRLILDGVVSSYDYNHSLGNGSLTDNQKAVNSFYTYCVESGPESCPLATSNSTADDIKDRVEKIIKSLYHNPLAINSASGPEILTYSEMKSLIFQAAYTPQAAFPLIAAVLAAVEVGQGDILEFLKQVARYSHIYSCAINGSAPAVDYTSAVPTYAVLCSDGIDVSHETLDAFTAYWQDMEVMAPTSGAIWSMLRLRCLAWKIKAAYKFKGDFGGNTSHPILFLSNTADPVTPLRSGRIMHNLFPNSGLLVSDQAGHCSIAAPNLCMLAHIKKYFQTGVLPEENTLCVPPQSPFSLNSTDPKSPFYDPSLEGMRIEEAMRAQDVDASQAKLQSAGWTLASRIVGEEWFGVGRLVGGSGVGREMLKSAAAEEWQMW
jgi:pimeloyl-ACP methyl ester carboxylesterase